MAGNWKKEALGTLCTYLRRGAAPAYTDHGGLLVLNQKCVRNQRVSFNEARRTDTEKKPVAEVRMLRAFDILVNSTGVGTLGRVAQVRVLPEPATVDSHVTIVRPASRAVDPLYLGMALRCFEADIEALGEGSTGQTELSRSRLGAFLVPVPRDGEQRAIAHILGTLDDKIELNRRMSEMLEAMARALFKSWFVDFDPVRAKSESRDPGLPKPLADLFPDAFEDSALGEIPKGWEAGTLGDVAEHPRRGVRPSEIGPQTPYIALEHMPMRSIVLADWGYGHGLESNKFKFNRGEILFGKLRPYFHKVGVAPLDGVCSTDIVVIRPKAEAWFGFVLGHASSVEFVDYTNAGSTGTKMPRTSWTEMARYGIALPPERVAGAFSEKILPAVDCIIEAIHESHTLAALRDALFLKLISGALRIENPERFLPTRE
jgi:type I restriction enzyme S subunit